MICKKCGTENVDTNKYCSSCGESLIKDIVSDSGMVDKNGDVKQSTKKYKKGDVESTKEYQRGKAQTFKRRHSNPKTEYSDLGGQDQPRTGVPRRYAAPKRALNSQKDSAAYDYNDNFDNNKYEKTGKVERQQYEYAQAMRRRRNAANIPYLIVTYFTALVSLLNFALPFLEWVRFQFSVDMVGVKIDTKLSIVQTIDKLFKINNVNDMLGDSINNILSWDVVPDYFQLYGYRTDFVYRVLFARGISAQKRNGRGNLLGGRYAAVMRRVRFCGNVYQFSDKRHDLT